MNTFKKKSLYVALAGVGALGVTGAAQAVSVNPDGLGQVLIYPYYTVRDKVAGAPFTSLLSVVNSTASAKAVKVRFLEGKNSQEVLDFNLYLSAKDVWVAAIIPTAGGAGIYTPDKSCTMPVVSASRATPTPFVNFAYTGSTADGAGTSLDRTRRATSKSSRWATSSTGSTTDNASRTSTVFRPARRALTDADGVAQHGRRQRRPVRRHDADQRAGGRGLRRRRRRAGRLLDDGAVVRAGLDRCRTWRRVNPKTSVVTDGANDVRHAIWTGVGCRPSTRSRAV